MSVLIKNMEMPKNCTDCDFESYPRGAHYCQFEMRAVESLDRPGWCPLKEAEPRWIPVTEKMPEEDGTYIITDMVGDVYQSYYYVKGMDGWHWMNGDAVAWMPLPEPYRKVEE